jgi:hypothetical protein
LNPANGSVVANLDHWGNVTPGGKRGAVFVLWFDDKTKHYILDSYDIHTFAPIASQILPTFTSSTVKMIRWGADGLAISTLVSDLPNASPAGEIYLLEGPFTGTPQSAAN